MGACQLARVSVGTEHVAGAVVGAIDLGDLVRGRVPDQLQEGDAALIWPLRCCGGQKNQDRAN